MGISNLLEERLVVGDFDVEAVCITFDYQDEPEGVVAPLEHREDVRVFDLVAFFQETADDVTPGLLFVMGKPFLFPAPLWVPLG